MLLIPAQPGSPPVHLTYCLNVHPGETWAENFATLRTTVLAVRDRVAPAQPFGLGLRLSAQAARDLLEPANLNALADFFRAENLYLITINGFPFGCFHGSPVKESVYAPDWRGADRLSYTCDLMDLAAALLPAGALGTISTVPCSWKPWIQTPEDVELMVQNFASCVLYCAEIEARLRREIVLALEPEPGCYLETTAETVRFFQAHLFSRGAGLVAQKLGCSPERALQLVRRHLGICLDTCHVALQFEDLAQALEAFHAAGIRVPKVQISSALRTGGTPAALLALAPFIEPVYLHQVLAQGGSAAPVRFWPDLPLALPDLESAPAQEIRVHFHVPLHFAGEGPLGSTLSTLTPAFLQQLSAGTVPHLEIETYTWDVLPPALRSGGIEESIAQEFAWLHRHMAAARPA